MKLVVTAMAFLLIAGCARDGAPQAGSLTPTAATALGQTSASATEQASAACSMNGSSLVRPAPGDLNAGMNVIMEPCLSEISIELSGAKAQEIYETLTARAIVQDTKDMSIKTGKKMFCIYFHADYSPKILANTYSCRLNVEIDPTGAKLQ